MLPKLRSHDRTCRPRASSLLVIAVLLCLDAGAAAHAVAPATVSPPAPAAPAEVAFHAPAGRATLPVVQVTTDPSDDTYPALVQTAGGALLMVATRYGELWSRTSQDGGATWSSETQIDGCCRRNPSLARGTDGTLWLAHDLERYVETVIEPGIIEVQVFQEIWLRTSTDGGATWSAERRLATGSNRDNDPAILEAAGGVLWLVWQSGRADNGDLWYQTSTDGGATWSAEAQLTAGPAYDQAPTVAQAADGRIVVAWNRDGGTLLQRSTTNRGLTWSVERQIAPCCRTRPGLAAAGGDLWLAYEQDGDIWIRSSPDGGVTWSAEARFTRFVAYDGAAALAALAGGAPGLAWHSQRSGNLDIWYGRPGERKDDNPPPFVDWTEYQPKCNLESDDIITVRASAQDETGVANAALVWTIDSVDQAELALADDGEHDDGIANDGVWGVRFGPLPAESRVSYRVRATDTAGNTFLNPYDSHFTVLRHFVKTAEILFVGDDQSYDTTWLRRPYADALDRLGYAHDTWDAGHRCGVDAALLREYAGGIVIWSAPYQGWLANDMAQPAALQDFLDAGGRLFITGQNIAQNLWSSPGSGFLSDYLHASFKQLDSARNTVAGVAGDAIGDGLALSIAGGDGAGNQYSKDVIEPLAPAEIAFTYAASTGAARSEPVDPAAANANVLAQAAPAPPPTAVPAPTVAPTPTPIECPGACAAGLHVDMGTYKVAYLAFGFEAIDRAEDRAAVMERSLAWLDGRPPRPVQLAPGRGQVAPAGPVRFSWLSVPGATSYQLQVDRTPAFDSPGRVDIVAPETGYTLTLPAQGDHYWRVRGQSQGSWGEWSATLSFSLAADVVQVTTDAAEDAAPALVETATGRLLAAFVRNGELWSRASPDGGATWTAETQIAPCCRYNPSLARGADGALWLAYDREGDIWLRSSTDHGSTWTAERQLTARPGDWAEDNTDPVVLEASDGVLWVVWQSARPSFYNASLWSRTSTDHGATWSDETQLTRDDRDTQPAIAQAADGRLVLAWNRYNWLWQQSSTDGGASWSEPKQVSDVGRLRPSLAAAGGVLWLVYDWDGNVWTRTSTDHGETWTGETPFTRYAGPDASPAAAALAAGGTGLAWQSERSGNRDIWFGSPDRRTDLDPPPVVLVSEHRPWPNPDSDDTIFFRGYAADETGVTGMRVVWTAGGAGQADLQMADDGVHGDGSAGDGVWGAVHAALPEGTEVTYRACATDTDGNSACSQSGQSFTVLPAFVKTGPILFVADGGGYNAPYMPHGTAWYQPYYAHALAALGYRYDTWDVWLRGDPGSAVLDRYRTGAVVWAAPYWGRVTDSGSDSIGQLKAYLDGGGRLFITGQNIAQSLSQWSGGGFLADYLHATLQQEDTGLYAVTGVPGDPIGDGLALNLSGGDGANDQYSKDEIDPVAPAQVVFTYRVGTVLAEPLAPAQTPPPPGDASDAAPAAPAGIIGSGTAGLRVDTGVYKVVYFAFGFEAISRAADRAAVMGRVLDWLGVPRGAALYLPVVLAGQNAQLDSFWADNSQLEPGSCTFLHWSVINAQAVLFDGEAVPGQDTRIACPDQTTTYELVVVRAGIPQAYRVTITIGAGES